MKNFVFKTIVLTLAIEFGFASNSQLSGEFDLNNRSNEAESDFYPQRGDSAECQACNCGRSPLCPPGVSYVMDGCGCCKICSRQLRQECSTRMICDPHKKLFCGRDGVCEASPGRACIVGGKWYQNGDLIKPTCKATCSCVDGDIGCVPTCSSAMNSPQLTTPGCLHPKFARKKGECCGKWICPENGILDPSWEVVGNQFKRKKERVITFKGSCMVQTSEWSACSKTCGFAISDRVSNDNDACKMTREVRLCNIRPCSLEASDVTSRKRPCRKHIRQRRKVRFSLTGCLSSHTYRPKYCGFCGDKCCKPKKSRSVSIKFECRTDGNVTSTFKRNMMLIKKCSCEGECIGENDVFSMPFKALGSDIWREN